MPVPEKSLVKKPATKKPSTKEPSTNTPSAKKTSTKKPSTKVVAIRTIAMPCLATKFGDIPAYTFAIKAKHLLGIHYVAVRGLDQEEGAVQRPLSLRRINDIKNYILEGNTFFNSFILNWTDKRRFNNLAEI